MSVVPACCREATRRAVQTQPLSGATSIAPSRRRVHGVNCRPDRTRSLQPDEVATALLDLAAGTGNEGGRGFAVFAGYGALCAKNEDRGQTYRGQPLLERAAGEVVVDGVPRPRVALERYAGHRHGRCRVWSGE